MNISFVGAPNSPFGNSIIFQGKRAPDQFDTNINKNRVPMYGTQLKYSFSPICVFAISLTNSVNTSMKLCPPSGTSSNFLVVDTPSKNIIRITIQLLINTCPWTW